MRNLLLILGSLGALLGAVGGLAQSRRSTVPAGCLGVKFRLGKPIRNRPDDYGACSIRLYSPGYVFALPMLHKLEHIQVRERNTDDEAIAVQLSGGDVFLARANMTYYLTNGGVEMALCRAVGNFDHQVATFFKMVVTKVLREVSPEALDIDRLVSLIHEGVSTNANLQSYGVVVTVVSLRELAPSPMTQLSTLLSPVPPSTLSKLAQSLVPGLPDNETGETASQAGNVTYIHPPSANNAERA